MCIIVFFSFFLVTTGVKTFYQDFVAKRVFLKKITSGNLFIFSVCTAILFLRLPSLLITAQNLDENLYIVEAASIANGAVFWKTLLAGTSGPLILYPLALLRYAGGINYASIRLFGIVFCILPSVFLFWKSAKKMFGETEARISCILLFLFFSSIEYCDFVAYSSEYVPVLLLSVVIYSFSSLSTQTGILKNKLVLTGMVLGLVPYAKLQAVPIAVSLGFLVIYEIFRSYRKNIKVFKFNLLLFVLSGLLPTVFVSSFLSYYRSWSMFIKYYIFSNLNYLQSNVDNGIMVKTTLWQSLSGSLSVCKDMNTFYLCSAVIVCISCVALLNRATNNSKIESKKILLPVIFLVSSFYSISAPGRPFSHYFILSFFPIAFFTAAAVNFIAQFGYNQLFPKLQLGGITLVLLFYGTILLKRYTLERFVLPKSNYAISNIAKEIKKYTHPNEKMIIWGWVEIYFVESELTMGGIFSFPSNVMKCNPNSESGIEQMNDLKNQFEINKPVIFLDAVSHQSASFSDSSRYRVEHFPIVGDYLHRNYTVVFESDERRVFVRNDRLK